MVDSPLTHAHRLLTEALDAVRGVTDSPAASEADLLSMLTVCEGATRQLDRATVDAVAVLQQRGAFADRGYASAAAALADLLRWERFEARRRVTAAEHV